MNAGAVAVDGQAVRAVASERAVQHNAVGIAPAVDVDRVGDGRQRGSGLDGLDAAARNVKRDQVGAFAVGRGVGGVEGFPQRAVVDAATAVVHVVQRVNREGAALRNVADDRHDDVVAVAAGVADGRRLAAAQEVAADLGAFR
ncbi:hypothetical protein RZS08_06595 [Arthrospira platensis SPKY1]|nr:hypothetical protein [Arthrospira platensis SPKY1]